MHVSAVVAERERERETARSMDTGMDRSESTWKYHVSSRYLHVYTFNVTATPHEPPVERTKTDMLMFFGERSTPRQRR